MTNLHSHLRCLFALAKRINVYDNERPHPYYRSPYHVNACLDCDSVPSMLILSHRWTLHLRGNFSETLNSFWRSHNKMSSRFFLKNCFYIFFVLSASQYSTQPQRSTFQLCETYDELFLSLFFSPCNSFDIIAKMIVRYGKSWFE